MSECKYAGRERPRTLADRHADDCATETCAGCLACPGPHCRVCGTAHASGSCAECVAEVRGNLHDIAADCDSLPAEVAARGINGEAMMLLGPAADPEARGHLEASVLAGRVPVDYLDNADHELHPLFVLGQWDMVWRDALEHAEPTDRLTILSAVDYLDRQLTYMAGYEHVSFSAFATQLRDCRTHLASVLHDEERGVRANVPCFDCRGDLERKLGKGGFEDHWTCRTCRRRYTIAEYNFALRASLETAAETVEVPA